MHAYPDWPFLSDPAHPFLSAVWAVCVHGLLAIIVVVPIVRRTERPWLWLPLVFIAGVAVDLDHAVVAASLNPRSMEHLDHRPDTHSLPMALLLAGVALVISRNAAFGWATLAIVLSHLLFDAAGGGVYWLYPLRRPDSIPWLACPLGIALLYCFSELIARRRLIARPVPSRRAFAPGSG